jgi:hypothetical protein
LPDRGRLVQQFHAPHLVLIFNPIAGHPVVPS